MSCYKERKADLLISRGLYFVAVSSFSFVLSVKVCDVVDRVLKSPMKDLLYELHPVGFLLLTSVICAFHMVQECRS